jgi:hypothetical protein
MVLMRTFYTVANIVYTRMNECTDDRNEYLKTFGINRMSHSDSNVRVHAQCAQCAQNRFSISA